MLGVAVYCVLAAWTYGFRDIASSTHLPACACGDLAQNVWFLAWPGYALSHGLNPLFSNAVNVPHGYNLFEATSAPLLGVLAAPLTLTIGPIAAFNLMIRLAFAVSASSMFLVLRRWTRWWPAAFLGGLLYGFSPYMIGEGYSHLFAFFTPFPPLLALLCDEWFARQRWRPLVVGGLFGLVAAAQLLVSLEVLTATLFLVAVGAVVLVLRHPVAAWERRGYLLLALAAAVVVFALLGGYPIWFYFEGPRHIIGLQHPPLLYRSFYDDVAGLVLPTITTRFAPEHWKLLATGYAKGNVVEFSGYLGIPLIAVLLVLIVWFRRVGVVILSAFLGFVAMLVTFGVRIHVGGVERLAWLRMPYAVILKLPVLKALLDVRFSLYVYLFAAVVLAVGLDRWAREGFAWRGRVGGSWPDLAAEPVTTGGPSVGRALACGAVAVVALLPLVPAVPYPRTPIPVPAFFSTSALRDQIPAGSVVLPYPNAERSKSPVPEVRSMLWQAVAGMRFRMIGVYGPQPGPDGHIGTVADLQLAPTVMPELLAWSYYGSPTTARPPPPTPAVLGLLRDYLRRYHVQAVVAEPVGVHPGTLVRYLTAALGSPPRPEGGVEVWLRVPRLLGD